MTTILTAMVLLLTTWSPPLPITTSSSTSDTFLAYDSATDQVFAAWVDRVSDLAISSIYSQGTGWGGVNTISMTGVASNGVSVAYNGALQNVFAGWLNNTSLLPTYSSSVASPVGWQPEASFSSVIGIDGLNLAYKADQQQMFAVWPNPGAVFYSVFSNHAWGPTGTVASGLTPSSLATIAYNSTTNQMFTVWINQVGGNFPIESSIYTKGVGWGPVQSVPSSDGFAIVGMVFNSGLHQMYIAWDDVNFPFNPTYAVFNGSSWTNRGPIDPAVSVLAGVNLVYDVGGKQLVAAWVDNNTHLPTYSFLPDGAASWTPSQPFPGAATARNNVSLAYDIEDGQIFASWADVATGHPIWTVFQSVIPVSPVTSLSGVQIQNRFLLQTDLVNVLDWKLSITPDVTGYTIYRNGQQIAVVNPFTTHYEDHNQLKGSASYKVVAFNAAGITSAPVQVTIN